MSRRIGLQIRDAFSLSFTKFKTRRIRTALTLISTSVVAFILILGSLALAGVMAAANDTPQSELADLHLASVFPDYAHNAFDANGNLVNPPSTEDAVQKVRESAKGYSLKEVYVDRRTSASYPVDLDLLGAPKVDPHSEYYGPSYASVLLRSKELIEPYIDPSQSTDWKAGDPLPILVPTDVILSVHEAEFAKLKKAADRVAKRDEYKKALLGKTGTLSASSSGDRSFGGPVEFSAPSPMPGFAPAPDAEAFSPLSVRVVGFLPASSPFGGQSTTDFAIPLESMAANVELNNAFNQVSIVYPSFASVKDRNAFVDSQGFRASIYADSVEQNKTYFNPLMKAFRIAVIVMLILMAIPMAATISKLLSDSQRETGVFRAIGARNHHIVNIYGLYAVQLALASFVLAAIAAEIVALLITAKWASTLELAVADFASTDVSVSFARFDFGQLGIILGGLVLGALLGAAIPILRALRRDPINSLRDE